MNGEQGWTHFESGKKRESARFALMKDPSTGLPRFLRIRDRGRDCKSRGRAYIVIDLWTGPSILKDQTQFIPRQNGE
jgi:hypothetical protein